MNLWQPRLLYWQFNKMIILYWLYPGLKCVQGFDFAGIEGMIFTANDFRSFEIYLLRKNFTTVIKLQSKFEPLYHDTSSQIVYVFCWCLFITIVLQRLGPSRNEIIFYVVVTLLGDGVVWGGYRQRVLKTQGGSKACWNLNCHICTFVPASLSIFPCYKGADRLKESPVKLKDRINSLTSLPITSPFITDDITGHT